MGVFNNGALNVKGDVHVTEEFGKNFEKCAKIFLRDVVG